MDPLEEMARKCFGYGRWEAPYWFIGLEEGMSGQLDDRIAAFRNLGAASGLSDCKTFHEEIKVYKWHKDEPPLESTWRVLMLLLLEYRRPANIKTEITVAQLKEYQSMRLGMCDGETALIELFGLPAKDLKAGMEQKKLHFSKDLLDDIHSKRTDAIHEKIRRYKPSLLVMYGLGGKKHFEKLAGRSLEVWDIFSRGDTLMSWIPHPASLGMTNERWIEHASLLRSSKP